jgi:Ca-activated chloride channel family protein
MRWATGIEMIFLKPEWLAILPLALVPVFVEWFRSVTLAAIPAGWNARPVQSSMHSWLSRWLVPFLIMVGSACAVMTLACPTRPDFPALRPPVKGHFWSVVLDCSGSMSIVDPGKSQSRLRILADALESSVRNQPQDRFAVVRVAGYADRVGPTDESARFLIDRLRQLRSALPGEDGTSLGDGLVVAAQALPGDIPSESKSILIVSDGRDNPPDSRAYRLEDIVAELETSEIRVDWLRLNLPEALNESPESRRRGESSRHRLETLVKNTGGKIVAAETASADTDVFEATLKRMLHRTDSEWTTASTASSILSAMCFGIAFVWIIRKRIAFGTLSAISRSRLISTSLAIGSLSIACTIMLGLNQTSPIDSGEVKSRWLLVLDSSPSMQARDAAGGSRFEAATRTGRRILGRLSLVSGARAGIVRFSGRAVPESGWSDDWQSLNSILEDSTTGSIRPTGSDWDSVIRTVLAFRNDSIEDSNAAIPSHVIFLTDGEWSQEPSEELIEECDQVGWKLDFITFGDDRMPGATIPRNAGSDELWIDPRTGKPARSRRNDELPRQLASRTNGRVLSVGSSDFDAAELADKIAGPENPALSRYRARPENHERTARFLTTFAFLAILGGEFSNLSGRLRAKRPILLVCSSALIFCVSCTGDVENDEIRSITESAWEAHRQGDAVRARAILENGIRRHPAEPILDYDLALVELSSGKPGPAIEAAKSAEDKLTQVSKKDSANANSESLSARIRAAHGYASLLAGQTDEAIESFDAAIESGALTAPETAGVIANKAFAQSLISKGENNDNRNVTSNENNAPNQTADSKPERIESKSPDSKWNRMAEEVRQRARSVRDRFEAAGDEIKQANPGIVDPHLIDW